MIIVQPATLFDLAALRPFMIRTFRATYAHPNEPRHFNRYAKDHFSETRLRAEFEHPNSWFHLVKIQAGIIAYCKCNTGAAQTEPTPGNALEIERIYVAAHQQKRGLGQLLVQTAVEKARVEKCDYIWLGVWEENPAAIAFYQKNGFDKFGEHTFMMGDAAQTDWMMRKMVEPQNRAL